MRLRCLAVVSMLLAATAVAAPPEKPVAKAQHPSPTQTDPDKYTLILENERVRVFRYHDEPGAKTQMHHHDAFVLYALAPFKRRLIFPDGTSKEREFKTGDVIFMEAQDHIGENTGTTSTEVTIVELKEPSLKGKQSAGWKPGPAKK